MDKYKQYVDIQWWNGIDKRDIENWIKNFGTDKKLAEIILDNVIFYNVQQMKAYARFLINVLKEQVYKREMLNNGYLFLNDDKLNEKWDKYISETNIIPAALPNDTASSAHKVLSHWRSSLKCEDSFISSISNINDNYKNGIRRFIFVDDFSGSGEQMLKLLGNKIYFCSQLIELGKVPDVFENVEIIIAVYVLHEKAKKTIKYCYPNVKIIYVDLINDDLNYLNENAFIYEKYDVNKRQEIINQIQLINAKIMNENDEMKRLSSYVLNIPVVFEHGCPNNTLLLLFAHADNWQQLFKRGKEI